MDEDIGTTVCRPDIRTNFDFDDLECEAQDPFPSDDGYSSKDSCSELKREMIVA